jgi:hypothetical protein
MEKPAGHVPRFHMLAALTDTKYSFGLGTRSKRSDLYNQDQYLPDCGAFYFNDAQVRAHLKERVGDDKAIDSMKFGGITE